MPDEPPREIEVEVEVLPPGAMPKVRPATPPPSRDAGYAAGTTERRFTGRPQVDQNDQAGRSEFEDPFFALLARLMDTAFVIPGTNIRFGLDPIIGLLPGIGDGATALTSLMLFLRAAKHGIPKIVLARMALNIVLNTTLGAIPVAGDTFSFFFKSNERNYELLRTHANTPGSSTKSDWSFVVALLGGLALVLVLTVVGYATVLVAIVKMIRGN